MKFKKIDLNFKKALRRKKREARWAEEDGTVTPSRLTLLKENLSQFFHSRPFKIYLTALAATAVAAAVVIAAVGWFRSSSVRSELAEEATFNNFVGESTEILKVSDLAIPDSFKGEEKEGSIRYREPMKAWTPEMAKPYKNDSRALAEDLLAEENEKKVREILGL